MDVPALSPRAADDVGKPSDTVLTSLVCETSVKKLPDVTCLWDAQAVSVGDKLYVGGGTTGNDTSTDEARLYTYIPKKESWHVVETPAYWFALTTYHSKLVLVGGVEVENNSTTDKLWTLHEQFLDSCIPSMGSKRFNASAISHSDHLVVAGGEDLEDDLLLNIVEVYDGYQWTEVQSLPSQCSSMKSTLYKRCWCLMGGYGQGEHVYFCSLDKIVDSCKSSDIYVEDLWGKLPDVPFCNSSPAVLGSRIIAIGGRQSTCYGHAVYAYSQKSESWLLVGELPYEIYNTCTSVLPTGELMVIGGQPTENTNIVFKIVLEGDEDVEMRSRWMVDVVHSLKQKAASLEEETISLKVENEHLRKQLSQKPIEKFKEDDKEKADALTKAEPTSSHSTATWDLRGVEVCGEMTVVVHSSVAQQITWEGFGLKLHIDEGSLPAGIHQCTLTIKASLAGQYGFPDNSNLVSAIFWLRCEPMCKFTKPVTVEIQHCARLENIANLTLKFVRAACSQKQLPYTFKELGGEFTKHSSYGAVKVNSFSGLAVIQKGPEVHREYCSKLFYLSNYFSGHRIDFVVTWNTETHLNVVKKQYKAEGAHAGPDQPVDFVDNEIRLDLPMEETKVNDVWTIVPLVDPAVRKNEVDCYLPGKRIPHCALEAHPIGDSVTRLVHRVNILGAKPPRNMFMLSYSPPRQHQVSSVGSKPVSPSESAQPKIKELQRELSTKVANEWEDIGIQLDIEEGILKQIRTDNAGECRACLREMLRIWLSRVDPPPTWSAIAEAVEILGHEDIAKHLRTNYDS